MTARAVAISGALAADGAVGESKGYITSNQDYYLKWTGPVAFRGGDKPRPALVAFNSTDRLANAEVRLKGSAYDYSQKMTLRPGANTVILENMPTVSQELSSKLLVDGKQVDALDTPISYGSPAWTQTLSKIVRLDGTPLDGIPQDARKIRLKFMPESAQQIQRIADDLMEYPWGCVEQTASRLIPMVMAAKALEVEKSSDPVMKNLLDRIVTERRRLVSMAGPKATFSWWGDQTHGNLLMTAHAYHADFRASRYLGIEIPKEAWENLLKVYADAKESTLLERSYALWVLSYIGQPIQEQLKALLGEFNVSLSFPKAKVTSISDSVAIDAADPDQDLPLLIAGALAKKQGVPMSLPLTARLKVLEETTWQSPVMRAAALAYSTQGGKQPVSPQAVEELLNLIRSESPTIDRAMTLAIVENALPTAGAVKGAVRSLDPGSEWKKLSGHRFEWKGSGIPGKLPVVPGAAAEVVYESAEDTSPTLNATIQRKLYRVNFAETTAKKLEDEENPAKLAVQEVKAGDALDSRALYVDELIVTPGAVNAKFLLAEVPLPPGGEVDGKSWGLSFQGFEANFVEPRSSSQGLGYAIPIEAIEGAPVKFHQLVRFSSRGNFRVPPAKLYRMYRPSERTFDQGGAVGELSVQ
jgi:uncharacterized protein YfaS (alpha-2-macroglobulin family)